MKFENRILSRVIPVCFFLMLAALMLATVFRSAEEYSYFENRNMAEKPAVRRADVLSGKYFTEYENYLEDHAAGRTTLIKLNTALDLFLRKPVVNNVVVTKDSLLPFNAFEPSPDEEAIEKKAGRTKDSLARHRDLVVSYRGRFCYVAVPCQYVCKEDEYPRYLNNRSEYTAASSAALFGKLESAGIEYIDMLREYRALTPEEQSRFTSSVDNHFSIFGAYRTYLMMMDKVNGDWGGSVPVLKEGDFTAEKIGNRYLGSRDRYLFALWNGGESLYKLVPENDVPFRRYERGGEVVPFVYKVPGNPYEKVTYNAYMGGDKPRTTIDTGRPELPSVLIYGDSFTNAVECITWYSFDRMDSVDFRLYNDKTLDELIDELRPDYVFCIRDYEVLIEQNANGK